MIAVTTRAVALALATVLLLPASGLARPLYFQNLATIYGLVPGDDIYACGVCHQRWEGTGGRNPYGLSVEQQLYLGKSIVDAILDIETDDTDGDGFPNGDELTIHHTLPGYSCANFDLAVEPPPNFQSLITPGVPSCLEPKDIRVTPPAVQLVAEVGEVTANTITLQNNGSDFPLAISDVSLLPGSDAALSVVGPALPFAIPVGASATVDVVFSPVASGFASGTVRITSDDPDEPTIDLAVSALGFVQQLAPPDVRGGCLKDMQHTLERLGKAHLREWGACYVDELAGVACDTARRDLRIGKAEAKLRAVVGGARDRRCAAVSLSAPLLGLPAQCGAPCDAIQLSTIASVADCLVCQQTAATNAMLAATVGTTPPDLPPAVLGPAAQRCSRQLVSGVQSGIRAVQRAVGRCELAAVLAGTEADCTTELAAVLAREAAKADARFANCSDTTGMQGCLFEPSPDPACLGTTATQVGTTLAETVFPD